MACFGSAMTVLVVRPISAIDARASKDYVDCAVMDQLKDARHPGGLPEIHSLRFRQKR
jgi:hypothetical protein